MAAAGGGGSASGVRAGRAFVEISARDAGIQAALKRLKANFQYAFAGVAKMSAAAGAVSAGAFALMGKSFISAGSDAADMANRLGTSVETVTGLSHAATLAGTSVEELESGLAKLMTKGGDVGENMAKFADEIAGMTDASLQAAKAEEIFGSKLARKMLPFLRDGAAGLQRMAFEGMRVTGMTTAMAMKADAVGDAFDKAKGVIQSFGVAAGAALFSSGEAAESSAQSFIKFGIGVRSFIAANGELIRTMALVSVGVAAAAAAVALFGTGMGGVGVIMAGAAVAAVAFGEGFQTSWTGIKAALASGDIAAAGKIGFETLKFEWLKVVNLMTMEWEKFKGGLNVGIGALVDAPGTILGDIWDNFQMEVLGRGSTVARTMDPEAERRNRARLDGDNERIAKIKAEHEKSLAEARKGLKKSSDEAEIKGWFTDAGAALGGFLSTAQMSKKINTGVTSMMSGSDGSVMSLSGNRNISAALGVGDQRPMLDAAKGTEKNTAGILEAIKKGLPGMAWGP